MSVSPVSLIAQKSYTNNGNKYTKSNAAKTILTGAALATTTLSLHSSLKNTSSSKVNTMAVIATTIYSALAALGCGVLIDGIINKFASSSADKKAFKEKLAAHQG